MMDRELDELVTNSPDADRIQAAVAMLRALPDEEMPRRLAFVSDKVFEPKWWQRFPVWGMASAAMIAASILAHGYVSRPEIVQVVERRVEVPAKVDTAALEAAYQKRLEAALKLAAAEQEKRFDFERRALMVTVKENFDLMRKQMNRLYLASASEPSERGVGQ
jgi:hypothetical protein